MQTSTTAMPWWSITQQNKRSSLGLTNHHVQGLSLDHVWVFTADWKPGTAFSLRHQWPQQLPWIWVRQLLYLYLPENNVLTTFYCKLRHFEPFLFCLSKQMLEDIYTVSVITIHISATTTAPPQCNNTDTDITKCFTVSPVDNCCVNPPAQFNLLLLCEYVKETEQCAL